MPSTPNQKFLEEWNEFIIKIVSDKVLPREFYHKVTKLRVRFDAAKEGATGFEGVNHWHIYNPFTSSKKDTYLDKDGNPVKHGSATSHIIPEKIGDD